MTIRRSKGSIIRESCVAGATIDVTYKMDLHMSGGKRAPKGKPSNEAVMKYNDRMAEERLTREINANFYPGDYHITLTYDDAHLTDPEEAKKELSRFLRRMKREFEKLGKVMRAIWVTEYLNHRIHHHVIMSYIDFRIICRQWRGGMITRCTPLDRSRDYKKLAHYLIKETQKTFRDPENSTKRRWSGTRNLIKPIVKREIVSAARMHEDPKPIKGYAIIPDSIIEYEHPFTGIEHKKYRMIATDPVPRLKTWRKGKIIDRRETYLRAEQIQLDMTTYDGWTFDQLI